MYYINLRWKESDFPLVEYTKKHLENNVKRNPLDHRMTVMLSLTNQIHDITGHVCDQENFDGDLMELEYRLQLCPDEVNTTIEEFVFAIWKITECYFEIIHWGEIIQEDMLPNRTFTEMDYDDFAASNQEAIQPSV